MDKKPGYEGVPTPPELYHRRRKVLGEEGGSWYRQTKEMLFMEAGVSKPVGQMASICNDGV